MKKSLKYLFIFLTPIFLLSYVLDILISKNLKNANRFAEGEFTTWNAVFDRKINSDIYIYGSSQAWVDFNPTMISDSLHTSVYNFGIDGHNFRLQYLRHKILFKNHVKPKIILLSVDLTSLEKAKDLYNFDQFLPYMLWNKDIEDATYSYNGFKLIDYKIPLVRYYGNHEAIETAFRFYFGHLNNPLKRIKGYQGQEIFWDNAQYQRNQLTVRNYDVTIDPEIMTLFEKFLNECKSQNIKLVFVKTPEYFETQKFVKNRNEILAIYTKYSKEYDIPFYDYSDDPISFQKKYFYNANHLNKTGAELFTGKLIHTLKSTNILQGLKNQ